MKNPSNYPIKCFARIKKNNFPHFHNRRCINSYFQFALASIVDLNRDAGELEEKLQERFPVPTSNKHHS